MRKSFKKLIVFFTLLCFLNASVVFSHEEIPGRCYEMEISREMANRKFSLSSLLAPYYLAKLCIYGYRFYKLKKDNPKKAVKLSKKCMKCSRKLGFKIKIADYIDDTCWKLSKKTGYKYSQINQHIKSLFGCKKKKGFEIDINEDEDEDDENDIDFNNIVERSIMEIVQTKGIITEEEYYACLRMDPELNVDDIILCYSSQADIEYSLLMTRTKGQDLEVHKFDNYDEFGEYAASSDAIKTELIVYITISAASGFISVLPLPPINFVAGCICTWSTYKATEILIKDGCDAYDRGDLRW